MGNAKIWILLILTTLFWAGNYVFGKYVVAEMTPLWMTYSRWVLALFILFPIAIYFEKPDWKIVGKSWLSLIVLGILGIIGYNMFLYSALEYTSATNAALINSLNPGVLVLFSVFLLRERLSVFQIVGLIISLAGVFIILTEGNLTSMLAMNFNRGDVLMIGAIIVWTFYSIVGKKTAVPPITSTAVSTLYAMIMLTPFALYEGINISELSSMAMTGIIYMFIFPSVFSFVFWNISVRSIGASQAGIFLNLIPVFTAIISIILGERIYAEQIFGGLLVFIGVYLTSGMLSKSIAQFYRVRERAG